MQSSSGDTGPKIGWVVGFLGASLWLITLAIVRLVNQDIWGGVLGLLLYLVCLVCIFSLRPWKHPQTRLWKLYTATMAPLLLAAGFFYWRENPIDFSLSGILGVVSLLFVLFLPVLLHGQKTWSNPQG